MGSTSHGPPVRPNPAPKKKPILRTIIDIKLLGYQTSGKYTVKMDCGHTSTYDASIDDPDRFYDELPWVVVCNQCTQSKPERR